MNKMNQIEAMLEIRRISDVMYSELKYSYEELVLMLIQEVGSERIDEILYARADKINKGKS